MIKVKEKTLELIQQLPDSCSFDDVMEALWIQRKIFIGQEQIKTGQGIAHEEVKKRLEKWLK
ncbi:MAG: hypothetical protein ACREOO_21365 [bacterium]